MIDDFGAVWEDMVVEVEGAKDGIAGVDVSNGRGDGEDGMDHLVVLVLLWVEDAGVRLERFWGGLN